MGELCGREACGWKEEEGRRDLLFIVVPEEGGGRPCDLGVCVPAREGGRRKEGLDRWRTCETYACVFQLLWLSLPAFPAMPPVEERLFHATYAYHSWNMKKTMSHGLMLKTAFWAATLWAFCSTCLSEEKLKTNKQHETQTPVWKMSQPGTGHLMCLCVNKKKTAHCLPLRRTF